MHVYAKANRKVHSRRIVGKTGATQGSCIRRDLTQQAGQPSYDRSTADDAILHGTRIQQGLALDTARGSLTFSLFSAGGARGQQSSPGVAVEIVASVTDRFTTSLPW